MVNDVVEMLPTAAWGQDLADALTAQHSRVGAHVGVTNTGGMTNAGGLTTDTLVVSSGTTLPAGDIAFTELLSTIFSGQVTTYTNPGTAGGTNTFFYMNLGGIKLFWGKTADQTSNNAGPSYTITLPVGFFTTVQTALTTAISMTGDTRQSAAITAASTVTVTVVLNAPNGAATSSASVIVIGT